MPEHHHRSTLKQQNKSFKGSSSSKRAIKRINKGKVPAAPGTGGGGPSEIARKAQRVHAAKQSRDIKRQELMKQKRGLTGSVFAGPRIVAVASITKTASVATAKAKILDGAKIVGDSFSGEGPVTAEVAGGRVTVVETGREMIGFLDVMSVADVLVLVTTVGDESMDAIGQHLLLTARNFALPSAICVVVQGLEVRCPLVHFSIPACSSATPTRQSRTVPSAHHASEAFVGEDSGAVFICVYADS